MVSAKITRDGFVKSDFGFQRKTKTDLPIFSDFQSKAIFGHIRCDHNKIKILDPIDV